MKPRYHNEEQILAAIEREKQRAVDLLKQSEDQKSEGKRLAKLASKMTSGTVEHAEMIEDSDWAFKQSKRLFKSSSNIMDKKLPKLGQKLAQFRTQTMPFVGKNNGTGDDSVSTKLNAL